MQIKVAVNCWVLRNKSLDGIGFFTINTISRIIKNNPCVEFLILCDKNFTEDYFNFPNAAKYRVFPALRHPLLYMFYMELVVPRFLKKHKPDIFVSTDGFLTLRTSIKQLPVVHDINFEYNPQGLKVQNKLYFRFFFRKFIKKAARIVTVSEYSKQDIATFYRVDPNKIDVVYNGSNGNFHPLTNEQAVEIRSKYSEGQPYFFFIGSMHPRKNISRLIQAFTLFKKSTGSACKLLLAGSILWGKSGIEDIYTNNEFKDDIIFLGRLPGNILESVLGAAFALTFVPLFEGFGVPILEAMQAGVPVICSNVTSMPEIAGDAAIFVDPYAVQSICDGMKTMYFDNALRAALIALGADQHKKFTWDKSSHLLWESINGVIQKDIH